MSFLESLRPCWAEVDIRQFKQNIHEIKHVLSPNTKIIAVVKSDAYGHGAIPISRAATESGCHMLAVALLEEALELRAANIIAPILVMGYARPEASAIAVQSGISLTIFSPDQATAIERAAKDAQTEASVHLKIETGMGRLGVTPGEDLDNLLVTLRKCTRLRVDGVFTHFAAADSDEDYTRAQLNEFIQAADQIQSNGYEQFMMHAANSAALLAFPETHLDAVRPGILLYGYYPGIDTHSIKVSPLMAWKARVAQVKQVRAGATVGYGRTYLTNNESTIATIPLGYADGYSRLLSSRGEVLIHGKRAKIAGRVCMDQIMVDVTAIDGVSPGDEVALLGRQGNEQITADDLAHWIGTISYEVLTSVSRRVLRIYCDESGTFASIRGSARRIALDV